MIWPLDKVAARDKSTVSAIQEYEEHFQQNLPVLNYPFFGRAEDLKKLEEQVVNNSARIVNINGPPAFGKSTLAIKLGELLRAEHQNTIKIIKYVDTETTRPSEYLCSETNGKNGWDQYSSRISEKAIIAHSDNYAVNADDRTSCQWSNQLKQRTVFILDNCEHILQGANKEAFYNFINSHLKRQNTKLTIIIVSQEKLFYTNDGFFALHIAELSTFESRAMLKYYLPKLSNKKADKLSVAVGHCPLALKVAAKLLQERGIDNFRILLKDLNDHSVRTLSSKVTIGEEKFRTIMDVAYMHLDKQTKKCSRLLSLFPGTTNSEMAKHILGSVVDLACIDDVVRKSFIEEIFIGEETRYSMHKLIRDFLREHHPVHKMSRNRHVFDRKFVAYYSNYLKESFKHLFGSKDDFKLNDKEDYILKSLETHNMLYYQNIAFHELKTDNERLEVLSDLAIAAGFLIQEDLVDPRVKLTMFSKTYVLYENKSIFTRLCESSSDQICANILWKVFDTLVAQECSQLNSNEESCESLFSCSNLGPFRYNEMLSLIQNKMINDSEGIRSIKLLKKLEKEIAKCGLNFMVIGFIILFIIFLVIFCSNLFLLMIHDLKRTAMGPQYNHYVALRRAQMCTLKNILFTVTNLIFSTICLSVFMYLFGEQVKSVELWVLKVLSYLSSFFESSKRNYTDVQ